MRENRIARMNRTHYVEEFLTADLVKDKVVQKRAINMHKQDVEYSYLYAHFRAMEELRKKGHHEKVQTI